ATLWHLRAPWRYAIPAAAVLVCAAATFGGRWYQKPDWRGLAREIARRVRPGELVLFVPSDPALAGPLSGPEARYLCVTRYTEFDKPVQPVALLAGPASEEVRRRIDAELGDSRVWVVGDAEAASRITTAVLPGYRLE